MYGSRPLILSRTDLNEEGLVWETGGLLGEAPIGEECVKPSPGKRMKKCWGRKMD